MEQRNPLSDFYQCYVKEELSKKDFAGKIFQHLLDNFARYNTFGGNRDRWNDFLTWLYPRFERIIDLYRDQGSSFDAYITGLVHNAAREYRCREANHHLTEYMCWQARAEEMKLFESEPEYPEKQEDIRLPLYIHPRHILFLLLKSYYFVSDNHIRQVAKVAGMEIGEVRKLIEELRKRRFGKEAEIRDYRNRVHCQYYRYLTYEKRMKAVMPDTDYHKEMRTRFERARKRFLKMKKRLAGMRMCASNRMIAEVMGIPKGTVDSGLFSIKSHLASRYGRPLVSDETAMSRKLS